MSPDDLVNCTQIADMAGVSLPAVSNWRSRHADFPRPWGSWGSFDLWLRSDVDAWLAHRAAVALEHRNRALTFHRSQVKRLEALRG